MASTSAIAAIVFDLDEQDLVALDDEDDVETIDEAWLEPDDDTVIDVDPDATDVRVASPSGYPPGLDDAEVHALIGSLTAELCRRGSVRRGTRGRG